MIRILRDALTGFVDCGGTSFFPSRRGTSVRLSRILASVLICIFSTAVDLKVSLAVSITWIGNNSSWIDGGSSANWNPADEPDFDDAAIFNTDNAVQLGSNNTIAGLTLSSSIELDLNGNTLN